MKLKSNLILTFLFTLFFFSVQIVAVAQPFPYQNEKLSPEQRAEDLLKRLTLEEKASLMQNNSPAIERLGIKAYEWWNEALHGVGRSGLATVFPQAIGMAASFDDVLLHEVFTAVSDEARAKSFEYSKQGGLKRYQGLTFWTPNINIFRDPRWGRGQETYGEDPYLTSRMGVAVVKGLQGPADAEYDKLHACAKHYAVHSGPEWNRHSFDVKNIDPRDLWETYLPAFKELVQTADVKEVMCAYNRFEGEPCCGSNRLLTKILREQWGYDGLVVSDCWAINDFSNKNAHATHPDGKSASASAVISGTDVECGSEFRNLPEAVKAGLITESQIDISVKRLLKARLELGEMNATPAWQIPISVVNSEEHQQLALKIAQESMVLLQNNNQILPLKPNQKIAVMGPNANDSVMQWGNYNGFPGHTVTLLEAMQKVVPAGQLIYEPGCDRTMDVAVKSLFHECAINGKNGFQAQYWNVRTPEGEPVVTDVLATPFRLTTTGATAFAAGVNIRDFSARYKTVFTPSKSGEVAFQFQNMGRASLTINGEQVVRNIFAATPNMVYKLAAEAGKSYEIEINFSAGNFDASLNFDFGTLVPLDLSASIKKVKEADIVVFAGGIAPSLEGEEMRVTVPGFKGGDRTDIELPAIQRRMLQALKDAGKKVVFVNFSGSAMGFVPETQSCEAILQAWYPGQAGGTAIANVLFGQYNPSGKLPVTFYKNVEQIPDFESYSMKGRTYRFMTEKPLFPFGFGLSYTTFKVGEAKVFNAEAEPGENVELAVPVTNAGKTDGTEVIQVYVHKTGDSSGPLKTLRAFQKVSVPAGKTVNTNISLLRNSFEFFDAVTGKMAAAPGEYEIFYGTSSDDKDLKKAKVVLQ